MEDDESNVKRRTNTQEKKRKKTQSKSNYQIMAVLFVVCLAVAVLANLIKKDVKFSESENRMLTERPKLNLQDVASGEYMSQFESYVSDQFILRTLGFN